MFCYSSPSKLRYCFIKSAKKRCLIKVEGKIKKNWGSFCLSVDRYLWNMTADSSLLKKKWVDLKQDGDVFGGTYIPVKARLISALFTKQLALATGHRQRARREEGFISMQMRCLGQAAKPNNLVPLTWHRNSVLFLASKSIHPREKPWG